jgi:hypothetical protein
VAHYLGYEYFHTHKFGDSTFAQYLPNRVNATNCYLKENFDFLCGYNSKKCNFYWAHGCFGNFERMRPIFIREIREAFIKFEKEKPNEFIIPKFEYDDDNGEEEGLGSYSNP